MKSPVIPKVFIKTREYGEVVIEEGSYFFKSGYLWSVILFGKYGILCEMDGSNEGCYFDYGEVALWIGETNERIDYQDIIN